MRFINDAEIHERLTYAKCIPLIRAAMIALSAGQTRQVLRSIIPLADGRLFGVMQGALGEREIFGAKLISVSPDPTGSSHQGVVILFDGASGAPICIADAGAITAIRTAAASAVATDALARPDASRLAILGSGVQAVAHARAIGEVRQLSAITIWGRSSERAEACAAGLRAELSVPVKASPSPIAAVADADIVCTVTASSTPVLFGHWVRPGTHLNLVGSSYPGSVEVDVASVAAARFIADSSLGVLSQGAEFLAAKAAGAIGDEHIVGEIGQVLLSQIAGRQSAKQITIYKSLGHIVQDLAAVALLIET